MEDLLRNY